MKVHRISIIGASGTGKMTLAKALAQKLGCPVLRFEKPTSVEDLLRAISDVT